MSKWKSINMNYGITAYNAESKRWYDTSEADNEDVDAPVGRGR